MSISWLPDTSAQSLPATMTPAHSPPVQLVRAISVTTLPLIRTAFDRTTQIARTVVVPVSLGATSEIVLSTTLTCPSRDRSAVPIPNTPIPPTPQIGCPSPATPQTEPAAITPPRAN